ncbi:MAG: PorT family protein [Muribaculaceae bacterium]|nr:PorT family protein [Muribaculaceae bacterium]
MKKLLLIVATAFMAISASAQVMSSYSYSKSKTSTVWYARLGVSFNNIAGASEAISLANEYDENEKTSLGSKAGMDIDFGFQRPISNFGLYWGMELGIGTRGFSEKYKYENAKYDDYYDSKGSLLTWNVKYSPFTFGYKYSLTDDIKLDAHIGAFVSYDFAGKKISFSDSDGDKWEATTEDLEDDYDYLAFDAGMQIGVGVWYKRLNLDLTYQRGFVPAAKIYYYDKDANSVEKSLHSSNFMIRLGVAF